MSVAINIDNVIKRFGKDTIINGLSSASTLSKAARSK